MDNQENPIAIDRLTGQRYGYRNDSDAGGVVDIRVPWTIESIQLEAQRLGKQFSPNVDIVQQLSQDLEDGAEVLFTEQDVQNALSRGVIDESCYTDLLKLVGELNDIAVIPKPKRSLAQTMLMQNRC